MGTKVFLKNPPQGDLPDPVKKVVTRLSKEKAEFYQKHRYCAGVSVSEKRVHCRTCGVSA